MSGPSTPKTATGIADLSVREQEILGKAWGCLKSGPAEIDYEKLAGELGMGNHRSAANAWNGIKKKLGSSWAVTGTPGSAKSTGAKRKKADNDKNDAADSGNVEADTPAPKKARATKPPAPRKSLKGAPAAAAAAAAADGKEEGSDDKAGVAQSAQNKKTQVKGEDKIEEEITVKPEEDDESDDEGV